MKLEKKIKIEFIISSVITILLVFIFTLLNNKFWNMRLLYYILVEVGLFIIWGLVNFVFISIFMKKNKENEDRK